MENDETGERGIRGMGNVKCTYKALLGCIYRNDYFMGIIIVKCETWFKCLCVEIYQMCVCLPSVFHIGTLGVFIF